MGENNYPLGDAECCAAYSTQFDSSLLNACADQFDSQVCHKEVYETISTTCDSVTLNRSVYMADETRVGAIIYTNDDVDSTALRCCLAHEDFTENPEACDENVVETFELMYLGDEQPDNMRCANITYS